MAIRRCKLCKNRVVEDSQFCQQHLEQAAMFSTSFGIATRKPKSKKPAGTEPEDEAAPSTERVTSAGDHSGIALEVIASTYQQLAARALSDNRWPQISLYFIGDQLYSRVYYSIVPATNGESDAPKTHPIDVDSEALQKAFAPGGKVIGQIVKCFNAAEDRLHSRELQTLDVHLATYARVVAVNELTPTQEISTVACFKLEGDEFVSCDLEDVRDQLRHEQW